MHQKFWKSPRFDADLAYLSPTRSRNTRSARAPWHLIRTIPKTPTTSRRGYPVGSEDAHQTPVGDLGLIRTYPHTLIHGNTHLGNICFVGGRPILFDWQVTSCGPAVKDLAYFAATSIDTDTRRAIDTDLVRAYVDTLNATARPD